MTAPPATPDPAQALRHLLDVMAALRAPATGCPWDLEQSFATIAPYTIEEAYEVADVIARADPATMPAELADELGDLLFQVVYHARLAEERGWFGFAEVAAAITAKMIRRHPHVFADAATRTAQGQITAWEAGKQAERAARTQHATLANLPAALPALTHALKLTQRAARVGFDWPDAAAVLAKLDEEVAELTAELPADGRAADPARIADEYGDMLFVLANLGRKLNLDPETCLRQANAKFTRRFTAMEIALATQGRLPADAKLAELEALWARAKQSERDPARSYPPVADAPAG